MQHAKLGKTAESSLSKILEKLFLFKKQVIMKNSHRRKCCCQAADHASFLQEAL
jgi:hypothetical protein